MNKVRGLLVLFLAVSCFLGLSSDKVPQDDKHGGKHYGIVDHEHWLKTKKALHLSSQHSYYNALDVLLEVHKDIPENHYIIFQIAELYYKTRDPKSAVEYYKDITDPKNVEYPIAFFHYGECLKQLARYDEALVQFKAMSRYRDKSRSVEIKQLKKWASQELRSCAFAINEIDKDTAFVNVDLVEGGVNKAYTDFSPMLSGDTLVFASLRQDSVVSYKYGDEKFFPVKLYQSTEENNTWSEPVEFWNVNHNEDHTANGIYTPSKEAFYFTRCHQDHHNKVVCAIYVKKKVEGKWGKAHKLHHKVNMGGYTSTQPTFGETTKKRRGKVIKQQVLYFVSDRPGGQGGTDLWYSIIDAKGKVSRPVNCGRKINTSRDEVSPFYDNENNLMYFSSNYHYALGGFDIQVSKGIGKRWGRVTNVGIPWNSSYDDTYYVPTVFNEDTLGSGFLVSNRPGGMALKSETCCDDIYSYDEYLPTIREVNGKVLEMIAKVQEMNVDSAVVSDSSIASTDSLTNATASIDSNFAHLHTVAEQELVDSLSRSITEDNKEVLVERGLAEARVGFVRQRHLDAAIIEGILDEHELAPYIEWIDTTGEDGTFLARLYEERQYALVVEKEGYGQEVFPVDWNRVENELKAEIVVTKIIKDTVKKVEDEDAVKESQSLADVLHKEEFEKNEKFVLKNMYFDSNLDQIKKSSEPSLQLLLSFMQKREKVKIEISGHTDSRGDDDYNLDLSQRRAESVREYLIDKGISPKRIVAKGYGETDPVAPNEKKDGSDNPAGRRRNRRTEVIILGGGK